MNRPLQIVETRVGQRTAHGTFPHAWANWDLRRGNASLALDQQRPTHDTASMCRTPGRRHPRTQTRRATLE
jgi:hypothetical protein